MEVNVCDGVIMISIADLGDAAAKETGDGVESCINQNEGE